MTKRLATPAGGANPNNCSTCAHKDHPDGGWCYMFRDEPTQTCLQHTGLQRYSMGDVGRLMDRFLKVKP